MSDPVSWLGLARKAGKLVVGEDACLSALRKGKAACILVASDAGDNTKQRFANKSAYYHVPMIVEWSRTELGGAIGQDARSVMVLTDTEFARQVTVSAKENSGGAGL